MSNNNQHLLLLSSHSHLPCSTEEGTNRQRFTEICKQKLLEVLTQAQQSRSGKKQVLYLDKSTIHIDNDNHRFDAIFSDRAAIQYLPSSVPHHLNPLDYELFGSIQRYYNSLPNETWRCYNLTVPSAGV